ncbi:hypothetical protein [Mycolicibacterium chlorophenolicum]|uniref:Uncharacterized protein n=1 Tax=Mycolicibacterium chlorophenolicum TaxID=37916 RepID=A0A0J6VVY6_9MYCO|nr:hypothetical protein [Mycolicibacterium chlorophenolicum]KMO74294.1 hypothetical protein MCHLDSM_03733 [Mycolicibacterium chlorophenolicum]
MTTSRWPDTATSAAPVEPLGTPDAGLARDLPSTSAGVNGSGLANLRQ